MDAMLTKRQEKALMKAQSSGRRWDDALLDVEVARSDFRADVCALHRTGLGYDRIAQLLGVSKSFVQQAVLGKP